MGTDADIEEKIVVDPGAGNNLHNGSEQTSDLSDSSSGGETEEPTFDTGLNTWLQVLGSFFLFFNSWYVPFIRRAMHLDMYPLLVRQLANFVIF